MFISIFKVVSENAKHFLLHSYNSFIDWKGIPKKSENEVAQNGGAEASLTDPVSPVPKPLPVPVPPIPVPAPITVPPPQVGLLRTCFKASRVWRGCFLNLTVLSKSEY